jgi:endonuclease/exonuclease/phosphatase family metal-dependent hydrolase
MPLRLRVATFNLENLDQEAGSAELDRRIEILGPQLSRLDADLLCLQEVRVRRAGLSLRSDSLDALLRATPYVDYQRVYAKTGSGRQSLAVVSRFPVVEHRRHRPERARAPYYRCVTAVPRGRWPVRVGWDRPLQVARVQLESSGHLTVVNLHLKSRIAEKIRGQVVDWQADFPVWRTAAGWAEGSFLSSMQRVGQALQGRELLDGVFRNRPDDYVAVCGDFNAEADEVPVRAVLGDLADHNNPELAASALIACEGTVPEASRYTLVHAGRRRMIDHVLVSHSLMAVHVRTEIDNGHLDDEPQGSSEHPGSDHAPVVTEFRLP